MCGLYIGAMERRFLLVVLTLVLAGSNGRAAQLIPVGRTFGEAWQSAGYPGEIPAPATIKNVRDFGAEGDGVTDDRLAIQNAINSFGGQPGVVYFPAGTYLMNYYLTLASGVVLRGERSGNTTILIGNFVSNHMINSIGTAGTAQSVTGGYTLHSSTITVANGSAFAAGDHAEIYQANDPAMSIPGGYDNSVGQMVRIASVNGNELTLVNPLRFTFGAPVIRKVTPIQNVGIENLRIARQVAGDNASRNNDHTIHFSLAANCWVRGVEGTNGFGANVGVERSTKITVSGNYFHSPLEVDGGGSGYGLKIQFHPGECLFEDNIFRKLRHSITLQAGPNGNVFGYNYSRETTRTETPVDGAGDIQMHGSWPFANLFEGNIVQRIMADQNSGKNGQLNTFFRNRTEGSYGIYIYTVIIFFPVGDPAFTNQNWVGNEVGGSGSYLLPGTSFTYGNNTASGVQPAGATSISDYSYYLNDDPSVLPPLPAFWTIPDYPTIGLPLSRTTIKTNPAFARYAAGTANLTVGPPSLAKQPTNFTANAGSTAIFSIQATGTPVAVYAWFKDDVLVPGQTTSNCTLVNVQPGDAGNYTALVTDGTPYSVRTAPATLTVLGGPTCTSGLSSPNTNVAVDGSASLSFDVTASDISCAWTTSDDAPWITNVFPTSTNGNATVTYAVAANASGSVRTGHVTAAGQTYTVTQDACTFDLPDGTSTNIPPQGMSLLSFALNANGTTCTWTASVDVPWITGLTPISGSDSATLSCSVSINPNSTPRTGHITAAGLTYTVNQLGAVSSFNDGVPDWWREVYFETAGSTNPQSCATCDATGTGQDNLFKYVAGLDPTNSTAIFNTLITHVPSQPGQMNLVYGPIAEGRTYTPLFSLNLTGSVWNVVSPISGPVTNGNQSAITDLNATEPAKFYHINISYP